MLSFIPASWISSETTHVSRWKTLRRGCIPNCSHLRLHFWMVVWYAGVRSALLFLQVAGARRICQETRVLVGFHTAAWNVRNTVMFTAATAKLMVCDEEKPENWALQVQYLWEAGWEMVVSSNCVHACTEIGFFFSSVDGHKRSWTYQRLQTSCALSKWWLEGNWYLFLPLVCLKNSPWNVYRAVQSQKKNIL